MCIRVTVNQVLVWYLLQLHAIFYHGDYLYIRDNTTMIYHDAIMCSVFTGSWVPWNVEMLRWSPVKRRYSHIVIALIVNAFPPVKQWCWMILVIIVYVIASCL